MSTKYRFWNSAVPHFITLTLVEWIDLFSREKYKEMIIENLKFYQHNKGLVIYAWVIMTNHIHLIVSSNKDFKIENIIRDFKRNTAKVIYEEVKNDKHESRKKWILSVMEEGAIISTSNINFKFWEHENHPVALVTKKMMNDTLNYIHQNPVKAGICLNAEDYKYSSAGTYAGKKGILDIRILEL